MHWKLDANYFWRYVEWKFCIFWKDAEFLPLLQNRKHLEVLNLNPYSERNTVELEKFFFCPSILDASQYIAQTDLKRFKQNVLLYFEKGAFCWKVWIFVSGVYFVLSDSILTSLDYYIIRILKPKLRLFLSFMCYISIWKKLILFSPPRKDL